MTSKRKSKKGLIIGVSVVVIAAACFAAPMLFGRNGAKDYTEETVKIGDITTYYSFSGVVESKNRESIISEKTMQVDEIKLTEGTLVKKDDVLIETTQGDEIKAPIDGEISKLYIEENEQIMPGAVIADLVDYDNLQITVKVDEYDLPAITVDKEVDVTIGAIDKEIKGKVSSVSKEATHVNGVSFFTATIDLEQDEAIKVGMSAEIKLLNQKASGATIMTMKALQFDENNKPYVFIKSEQNEPMTKYVQVGMNDGTTVEITEGLTEGDILMIPKAASTAVSGFGSGQGMGQSPMGGGASE
ncbi:MAG: HlyD family efflux transporter periplasmic adaptor subunit [Clostridia bacterium]|jgi:HlyD family secretion protein|nr:HlyD family efflux transporter periplasmic adaptor subunit [Clostridia bacterium]